MNLTDEERETLRAMRAITIDENGSEIFVGLDPAESDELLAFTRRDEAEGVSTSDPRFRTLREKHEAEREAIAQGQEHLDRSHRI
ncbi:hypothetical protein [Aureimonas mangrovi]|uniref:hypothetical protein n=1 Tax=Aureimonas mangrovi TaxID=2758041 RepID=UPI00163DC764|nr:hypothetical protein [Aureimonas mangrovi]